MVKLGKDIKQHIRERIKHYHEIMGIKMPPMDRIFFDKEEWIIYLNDTCGEDKKYNKKIMRGDILGTNFGKGRAMFIDVLQHRISWSDTFDDALENTICHEVMHTKYTNMRHGGKYDSFCHQIIKGIYPPLMSWKDWFR